MTDTTTEYERTENACIHGEHPSDCGDCNRLNEEPDERGLRRHRFYTVGGR